MSCRAVSPRARVRRRHSISKRRHNLVEVILGPDAWDRADEVRRRPVAEVKARRSPRTSATVDQLLDRYLDEHQGGASTVTGYRQYRRHVTIDPGTVAGVTEHRRRCEDRVAMLGAELSPMRSPSPSRRTAARASSRRR